MKKWKWVFFFLCLGLILYLNLQVAETFMNLSNKTGEVVTAVVMVKKTWIQRNIRKQGHTGEYFLLGLSSFGCFGWKGLLIDTGVSFADQCFKGLIPVRYFDWTDIPFDMAGYVTRCFVGWVGMKIMKKRRLVGNE